MDLPYKVTGGYPRKSLTHGVKILHDSLLRWQRVVVPHLGTIGQELIVQEPVDNKYLGNYDKKVGSFANIEHCSISCVLVVKMFLKKSK